MMSLVDLCSQKITMKRRCLPNIGLAGEKQDKQSLCARITTTLDILQLQCYYILTLYHPWEDVTVDMDVYKMFYST